MIRTILSMIVLAAFAGVIYITLIHDAMQQYAGQVAQ